MSDWLRAERASTSLQAPNNVHVLLLSFTKHVQKRIRALCQSCTALAYTSLCSIVHLIVCIGRSLVFRDSLFHTANDIGYLMAFDNAARTKALTNDAKKEICEIREHQNIG